MLDGEGEARKANGPDADAPRPDPAPIEPIEVWEEAEPEVLHLGLSVWCMRGAKVGWRWAS